MKCHTLSVLCLQEAQKMVDFILRHGNDLLAVECLRGYEVRANRK